MGCPLLFFRPLASIALGILFFIAFFAYLLFNMIDSHLLSSAYYAEALSENNVYSRLYDEVLVDPALEDEAKELLGNVEVPQEDVAAVARNIMPPLYLQGETERGLDNLIGYLKKDTDDLDLYIDLSSPLDNASQELVKYAEQRIDAIEVVQVGQTTDQGGGQEVGAQGGSQEVGQDAPQGDDSSGGEEQPGDQTSAVPDAAALTQQALKELGETGVIEVEQIELGGEEEWTAYWEETVRELEAGQLPSRVPSLAGVSVETRLDSYDMALEELRQTADVPAEVLEALEEPDTDTAIREALLNEDPYAEEDVIKTVLKAATSGVLPTLVDDTLDDVRRELVTPGGTVCEGLPEDADLSSCTRYDVLSLVDEDLEANEGLNSTRDSIALFGTLGSWLPLAVLVAACVGIVIVNLPRLASMLRWIGLALGVSGLFFLVAGVLVGSTVSNRLSSILEKAIDESDAPDSVAAISSDVTSYMADSLSLAMTSPSITVLALGVALFAVSFFLRKIPIVRSLPFVSSLLG